MWGNCVRCGTPFSKDDIVRQKLSEQKEKMNRNEIRVSHDKIERGGCNLMGVFDPLIRKYNGNPFSGIGIITNKSGRLKTEIYYNNGYQVRLKNYHKNGIIKSESEVKDGDLHGKEMTWFDSGRIESVVNYNKGKSDGSFLRYYESGVTHSEGQFTNDDLSGRWKYYNENGVIYLEVDYKDDIPINMIGWDENQNPRLLSSWVDNKTLSSVFDFSSGGETTVCNGEPYTGMSFENFPSGEIKSVREFDNGCLVSENFWDEVGQKIDSE